MQSHSPYHVLVNSAIVEQFEISYFSVQSIDWCVATFHEFLSPDNLFKLIQLPRPWSNIACWICDNRGLSLAFGPSVQSSCTVCIRLHVSRRPSLSELIWPIPSPYQRFLVGHLVSP